MPNGRLEISGRFGNFWLPDWHLRILYTVHRILTIFRSCGPRPPKNQTFDKPGGSQTAKYPDNGTGTLKPTHGSPHTDTHSLITTFWYQRIIPTLWNPYIGTIWSYSSPDFKKCLWERRKVMQHGLWWQPSATSFFLPRFSFSSPSDSQLRAFWTLLSSKMSFERL